MAQVSVKIDNLDMGPLSEIRQYSRPRFYNWQDNGPPRLELVASDGTTATLDAPQELVSLLVMVWQAFEDESENLDKLRAIYAPQSDGAGRAA